MKDHAGGAAVPARKGKMNWLLVSAAAFLLGVAGLTWAEHLEEHGHASMWTVVAISILKHSAELAGAAGLVGLLVEIFVRRELMEEIVRELRALFRIDPAVADAFNTETRQEIVRTTLKAHLGNKLGPAIFNGLIQRYFEDKYAYREQAIYDITLRELAQDRAIGDSQDRKVFAATEYFEVVAKYEFSKTFSREKAKYVICLFGKDWDHLLEQFKNPNCILRETLSLDFNQQGIGQALKRHHREREKICDVSVKIDRQNAVVDVIRREDSGIVFEVKAPHVPANRAVLHQITIRGLLAKSVHRFPIIIVEPTLKPIFTFTYPATVTASALHLLAGDPDIDQEEGKISIKLRGDEPEEGWVFPNSGVVFVWEQPASAVQPPAPRS